MEVSCDSFAGCVSTFFSGRVHPRWKEHNDAGNAAFRDGKLDQAAVDYTNGFGVARFPMLGLSLLKQEAAKGSPSHLVASEPKLVRLIESFATRPPSQRTLTLQPSKQEVNVVEPNTPAAICCCNRAAVRLRQNRPRDALMDARRAAKLDPSYVTAHRVEMEAYEALGLPARAAAKRSEIERYRNLSRTHTYTMAMLAVGWLSWVEYAMFYERIRVAFVLEYFHRNTSLVEAKAADGKQPSPSATSTPKSCLAMAMRVKFKGSMCLVCSLRFFNRASEIKEDLPAVFLRPLASEAEAAPRLIECLTELTEAKVPLTKVVVAGLEKAQAEMQRLAREADSLCRLDFEFVATSEDTEAASKGGSAPPTHCTRANPSSGGSETQDQKGDTPGRRDAVAE